jgi:hypothetical protein
MTEKTVNISITTEINGKAIKREITSEAEVNRCYVKNCFMLELNKCKGKSCKI